MGDVAKASGIGEDAWSALERGEPAVSTAELAQIADLLSLDFAALLRGEEVPRPVPSVFLRHQGAQDFDERDARALDEALEQGRAIPYLVRLVGRPLPALQAGMFTPHEARADRPDAPARDGYASAREVRQWMGDPAGALGDLAGLVERRFGIAVVVASLHSSRLAAASVRAGEAAAVVLNAQDPLRQANPLLARVHIAHELCHVLFDPSDGGVHVVIDETADRRTNAAEQRARAFAAELLLPIDGLTALLGPPLRIREDGLAQELVERVRGHFGTPHEITANHLCNLGFVDSQLRSWLENRKTRFSARPPVSSVPRDDEPSRYVAELTEEAHRGGLLTDGEARRMLLLERFSPLGWEEQAL